MPQKLTGPGVFRCTVDTYSYWQNDDQTQVKIVMELSIVEWWNEKDSTWTDLRNRDIKHTAWYRLTKKDGSPIKSKFESLMKNGNWSGSLEDIRGQTWEPVPFQLSISQSGKYLNDDWINPWDDNPADRKGGAVDVPPEIVKTLDTKFAGEVNAIRTNLQNAAHKPPEGTSAAPPTDAPTGVPAAQTKAANEAAPDDDIPF